MNPTVPAVFAFQSHEIRTVVENSQIWFVAKDVCHALNIDWSGKTLSSIPREWRTMGKLPMVGKLRRVTLISEPAVYKLAFRSNKPEADAFTNWVASEVLPAIRKDGNYNAPPKQPAPALPAADKWKTYDFDKAYRENKEIAREVWHLLTTIPKQVEALAKRMNDSFDHDRRLSNVMNRFDMAINEQENAAKRSAEVIRHALASVYSQAESMQHLALVMERIEEKGVAV